MVISQGFIVLQEDLVDRGNAFFIKFVEALTVFLPIHLVGPVCVELYDLLCLFSPSSIQHRLKLVCKSFVVCC